MEQMKNDQPALTVCENCDGTGDVHRADGEWLGECICMKEHRERVAAGDLLAIAEEVGGQRTAPNVAQVTREDLARLIQFVRSQQADAQPERRALEDALKGMIAIHEEPSGFAGKYGRALDDAIAAQKVKIDQRIAAARSALSAQGDIGA